MGGHGCTVNGTIDDSRFNEPMPWIGIYVAVASAACSLAMAIDAFHGFRYRKFWFPCKFFSLNATSLTLITVATKLSVDLNTSMPRKQDQLAKLSSSVLICTMIGNFMPSIGTMQNTELLMNIMALLIFVVTVVVNICIQLGTGVIYVFWREHAAVMFLMILLLVILFSSSLTVPITKSYFDEKYKKKYKIAVKECSEKMDSCSVNKLSHDLRRFWMMAHTCSPQFVMGRLATCTASGAVCLISTLVLLEAILRSYLMPGAFNFCNGESDYKWSSTLILITQIIAIVIGSIAPASRWLLAINFRCPKKGSKAMNLDFGTEKYWTKKLNLWKDCPVGVWRIHGRYFRKLFQNTRVKVFELCIWVQIGIVVLSKIVRLISILFMIRLQIIEQYFEKLIGFLKSRNAIVSEETELRVSTLEANLGHFVLHLEGEAKLIDVMMERDCDVVDHFIEMGRKKQPKHLQRLLEKIEPSRAYEGVRKFDSEKIPSLNGNEPPNSWTLPVITLTSIALSLPRTENSLVKDLIRSINEALIFIRVVEQNVDGKSAFISSRYAAEIVWVGVDLHHKWLDLDLHKMASEKTSAKEVLEGLSSVAKDKFHEFADCLGETPSKWPVKALAANSMYRICQTLLLHLDSNASDGKIFERLCSMITDIVGACLSNLHEVISMQCHGSAIEEREDSVRNAIILLGKTEKILRIIDRQLVPSLKEDRLGYIDEWRGVSKTKNCPFLNSPSSENDLASENSCDLYVTIE